MDTYRQLAAAAASAALGVAALGAAPLTAPGGVAALAGVAPLAVRSTAAFTAPPTTAQCVTSYGLHCYSPAQLQAAYDMGPLYARGLDGKGRTIVIVDSFGSPTIKADLAVFDTAFHLSAPPHFDIIQPAGPVPPFDPTNSVMAGWATETSLDVEYAHAMAPGANILLVETPVAETEGIVGIPQIVKAENYVISHKLGDVITQSFGATEATFSSKSQLLGERSAFVAAAAAGVTVLASSGDEGPTDAQFNGQPFTHRVDSWPSTDPLVTSVGGTQLHLSASGTRVRPDNVWNDTALLGSPSASGGGVSAFFSTPTYQSGVASVVGTSRGTPDVAMSAAVDGGALVYWSFDKTDRYNIVGGTSEASPLFSGIVAIADQAAGKDLGLLNPSLYNLPAAGGAGLNDITSGNTTVSFFEGGASHTVLGYAATTGYDLASGLGTPDGAALVTALAG